MVVKDQLTGFPKVSLRLNQSTIPYPHAIIQIHSSLIGGDRVRIGVDGLGVGEEELLLRDPRGWVMVGV